MAFSASSSLWVFTVCWLEKAAYKAVCTAASISAPEYPLRCARDLIQIEFGRVALPFCQVNGKELPAFGLIWQVDKK